MSTSDHKAVTNLYNSLNRLQAQPGPLSEQVKDVVGAAERLAEAAEQALGSCERGRPFADMFIVATAGERLVWRCAHNPPHADIPV